MKRSLFFSLISVSAVVVSGVGSYVTVDVLEKNSQNSVTEKPGDDGFVPGESETPQSNFSKFCNKVLTVQELKAPRIDLVLSGLASSDFTLSLTDLDINLSSLFQSQPLQLKGGIQIQYDTLVESLDFALQNNYVYLSTQQNYFAVQASQWLSSFTPILDSLGLSLPFASQTTKDLPSFDFGSIIGNLNSFEQFVTESKTEEGYTFALDLSYYAELLQLPLDHLQFDVFVDDEYNLRGLATGTDGIVINSSYQLKIDCDFTSLYTSEYQPIANQELIKYVDMTEFHSHLCSVIAEVIDTKKFEVKYDAIEEVVQPSFLNLNRVTEGTIKADLSAMGTNLNKGTYELTLDQSISGKKINQVYALYRDDILYYSHNDLIHFRLDIGNISDNIGKFISTLQKIFGKASMGVEDSLPASGDLIETLLSVYQTWKKMVQEVQITSKGILFKLQAPIPLSPAFYVTFESSGTEENKTLKLTVQNASQKYARAVTTLVFDPVNQIDLSKTEEELSRF